MRHTAVISYRYSSRQYYNQVFNDYDVIVNCSGLGAMKLVPDQTMYPIRGQVVRVKAPFLKQFYIFQGGLYALVK